MLSLSNTLNILKDQILNKPVEIHDIYLGAQTYEDSDTLHFVNFYQAITFFTYISHISQAYTPLGMNRTAIKKTAKGETERITYKVDNVNKGMSSYAASKNFRDKRIVTRLIFRDTLTSYLDAKTIFDGYIQSISFDQKSMAATAIPRLGALSFEPGWPYQIECNAKFGDAYCTISKDSADNRKIGTATGGTVSTLIDTVVLTQANDYWNFGTVTFTSGSNNGSSRKIIDFDNAANKVTFDYALDNVVVAEDAYIIYRGCDKTLNMCENTYINTVNYHGFHTIPLTK